MIGAAKLTFGRSYFVPTMPTGLRPLSCLATKCHTQGFGTGFATLDNDECLMINESNIHVILNEYEGSRKVGDKVHANERMQIHLQFSASAAELNNKL